MNRYEYCLLSCVPGNGKWLFVTYLPTQTIKGDWFEFSQYQVKLVEALNAMAQQGWQLVSVYTNQVLWNRSEGEDIEPTHISIDTRDHYFQRAIAE